MLVGILDIETKLTTTKLTTIHVPLIVGGSGALHGDFPVVIM